ncbi:MAG: GNAT family N-acetyltransferase [Candidatus Cloacimonadota bacterium]|nr:MAG: GNAT family N-acetyltransferase [Candidatus Cloacimonadota bacterium]
MNLKIKKFYELNIDELYEILRVRNEVFTVEQKCRYLDCDGKDQNSYHLFYEKNDKIIAYLRILEKGVSFEEIGIGRVAVDAEFRRRGLARDIMSAAVSFIKNDLKEHEIKLQAQTYLIDFYKSLGFEKVSEIYQEAGIPHVDMLYHRKKGEK